MAVGGIVKTAMAARKTAVSLARLRTKTQPERYFMRVVPAPWLCHGELGKDGRTVQGPVRDLRDVLRAVAFDLRPGGGRCRLLRVLPYGDLSVSGGWGRRQAVAI